VLIDPELAERARAQLSDPGEPVSRPSPLRERGRPTRQSSRSIRAGGASAGHPRVTPGRISRGAVLALLASAAALAAAAALWARYDDGSSQTVRHAQTPTQPGRVLGYTIGERADRQTPLTGGVAGARYTRRARPPAFNVPGATKEPLDEIALPVRARRLDAWLTADRGPTAANQRHWLYQHSWIVAGARFGWWRGAEALRLLIRVDRRIESRWGIGYRSEVIARQALASVEARMK
jgi:hypothetical protein